MNEMQNNQPALELERLAHPSNEERTYGLVIHLSALAAYVLPALGSLIGPLVAWLVWKDRSKFADDAGKEALNFQLTLWAVVLVAGAGIVMTLGLGALILWPVFVVVPVVQVIFAIVAAIAAQNGEAYRYPLSIRFLK